MDGCLYNVAILRVGYNGERVLGWGHTLNASEELCYGDDSMYLCRYIKGS